MALSAQHTTLTAFCLLSSAGILNCPTRCKFIGEHWLILLEGKPQRGMISFLL